MDDMNEMERPYRVELTGGVAKVVDESGRVVLNCGDVANAEQYAVLLNQAFERGYKAGYRAAKRA